MKPLNKMNIKAQFILEIWPAEDNPIFTKIKVTLCMTMRNWLVPNQTINWLPILYKTTMNCLIFYPGRICRAIYHDAEVFASIIYRTGQLISNHRAY